MRMDYYCRLCLKWDSKMYDIFSDYPTKVKMYEIVEKLCDVPVNRHDRLPKWICLNCKNQLIEISNFITVCKESYNRLKCPTYIIQVNNQQHQPFILKKPEMMTRQSMTSMNVSRSSMPLIKVVSTDKIMGKSSVNRTTKENKQSDDCDVNDESSKVQQMNSSDVASSSDNVYSTNNPKTPVIRVVPKNFKFTNQQPQGGKTAVISVKSNIQDKQNNLPANQVEPIKTSDKPDKCEPRPILLDPAIFSNQRNVQKSLQKFRKILPKPSSMEMQQHHSNQLIAVPIVPVLKPIPVIRKNTCATVVKYLNSQQAPVDSHSGVEPMVDIKQEIEEDPLRIEDCDNLMSDAIIKEEVIIPDVSPYTDPPDAKKVKRDPDDAHQLVICDYCKGEFTDKLDLRRHMFGNDLKPKQLTCLYCTDTFFNQCARRQHHSQAHNVSQQFVCPMCHQNFSQQKHLYQHLVTHLQIATDSSEQMASQQIINNAVSQQNYKIAAQGQMNKGIDN